MAIERYQINVGDTLQQIARRILGSADQWWLLASFNKLDYPFIDTSGAAYPGQNVLGIGSTLLIVKDIDDPDVKRATIQVDPDQYTLLFGTDLAQTAFGDLRANPATGDWETVAGLDNLVGAIYRRLQTHTGIYPYHPEYGSTLEDHIGQAGDPGEATAVRLDAIQTLLNDPRIVAVRKVELVVTDDHVDVNILSEVIGANSAVPMNIVLSR